MNFFNCAQYVANLAAFLTKSEIEDATTMEGVVAAGYKICAHPAVKAELDAAWPDANFYYHEKGREVSMRGAHFYLSGPTVLPPHHHLLVFFFLAVSRIAGRLR